MAWTMVECDVMADTIEQRPERPAKGELDRAADHSPDKAHRSWASSSFR
jgi:hypothetical protein